MIARQSLLLRPVTLGQMSSARRLVVALACAMAVQALAAQVVSGPQRAVNWDKALATVARYRPVVDVSGLVEVDAQIPPGVNAEDLQALCDGGAPP